MSSERKGKAPFYFTYLPCYLPSTPGAAPFTAADSFDNPNARPDESKGFVTPLSTSPDPESPSWSATATLSDSAQSSPRSPQPSCSTAKSDQKGKKIYDTWSQEEKRLLVHLWSGHFEKLQRKKDTKKVWQNISDALHSRLGSTKGLEKCTKKMKYLIERYREAKEAGSKRADGFIRKSAFYDDIDCILGGSSTDLYTVKLPKDVVTFRHVVQTKSCPVTPGLQRQNVPQTLKPVHGLEHHQAAPILEGGSTVDEVKIDEGQTRKQDARTERKKSGKKRKVEEDEDEERKMFKETFEKFQDQGDKMVSFMESFSQMQNHQMQMMNHFLECMMQLMQSNQDTD